MRSTKFTRNYERTRGYLAEIDKYGPKVVLNSLYNVFPIAFEKPGVQKHIRAIFADQMGTHDLFSLNLSRLYRRSNAHKVALCCMPKSGSTFVLTSLQRLPDPSFSIGYLQTPYMNPDFVQAHSREHEIDELALLALEMRETNWVSHMHTKWTPYSENIFSAYGIKPIVTYRNIFDCLVSLDDMLMAGTVQGFAMIRLPAHYGTIPEAERLAFLCAYVGPWYIDYVVSWSRITMPVLRLNYDEDILGFGRDTAQRIKDFLDIDWVDLDGLMEAFRLDDGDKKDRARLNKGVSGRGDKIPETARAHLRQLASVYADEVDFSGLL